MATDDFIESLRTDWRSARVEDANLAEAFAHHRHWVNWTLFSSVAGTICILICFLWLARMAIASHDRLLAVSALAFAAALPVVIFGLMSFSSGLERLYDQTPEGLLRQTRDRYEEMIFMLAGARWCAAILAMATVIAMAVIAVSYPRTESSWFAIVTWGVTAVLVWLWQRRRGLQLGREIVRLNLLIAQFDEADALRR